MSDVIGKHDPEYCIFGRAMHFNIVTLPFKERFRLNTMLNMSVMIGSLGSKWYCYNCHRIFAPNMVMVIGPEVHLTPRVSSGMEYISLLMPFPNVLSTVTFKPDIL